MTAREARIIENSRRANQFGTPEYIEANDPVKKEKRAGWIGKWSSLSLFDVVINKSQLLLLRWRMMASITSITAKVFEEQNSFRTTQGALRILNLHDQFIVQHHHIRLSLCSNDNRHAPVSQHRHQQHTQRPEDRRQTS